MTRALTWLRNAWGKRDARAAGAYRLLFDPTRPEALTVLADLAAYCNVGVSSFVPGDPCQTAWREGQRDVFLHLAEILGIAPAEFARILKEIERD